MFKKDPHMLNQFLKIKSQIFIFKHSFCILCFELGFLTCLFVSESYFGLEAKHYLNYLKQFYDIWLFCEDNDSCRNRYDSTRQNT
jgi:hypothetical protein